MGDKEKSGPGTAPAPPHHRKQDTSPERSWPGTMPPCLHCGPTTSPCGKPPDLDDCPCLEAQLLFVHGHVVPQGLRADHAAIAYQLEWERWALSTEPGTLEHPRLPASAQR